MKFFSTGLPALCITLMYYSSIMKDHHLSGKYNKQVGNQTAKDFFCFFFFFHFPMKAAKVMFVVARRNPRPPALNDCPLIAACSSDNYSLFSFCLKHASHKRSLQWPWAIGQHFCGALSKPIFFKDTVICLSAKFICLLFCVHMTDVILKYTH